MSAPTPTGWASSGAGSSRARRLGRGRRRPLSRDVRGGCAPHSITPMVTLYHFTLPTWVAARGGWDWDGAPAALAAFAGRAGAAFGDVVDWWCTINEPNVLVAKSYLAAQWPPGVRDPRRAALVLAALMRAHGLMARALRDDDRGDADGDGHATRIGIAQNLRIFDPYSARPDRRHRRRRRRLVLRRVVPRRGDARAGRASCPRRDRHRRTVPAARGQLRLPRHQLLHARSGRRAARRGAHALQHRRRARSRRATISAGRSTRRASTGCWSATRAAAGRCS